jgi:hypothetical protein
MDLNVTNEEEQRIDDAIESQAFVESSAKELFCENWSVAKDVLEVLKDILPAPIPGIIGIVIKFGDRAHSRWCSGS